MTEQAIVLEGASAAVNAAVERRRASRWLTGLAALTYLLIIWGALVRLTGSGISIPDWPFINGSLLPPMSQGAWQAAQEDYRAEATRMNDPNFPPDVSPSRFRSMFWVEYLHRTLAALAGIGFLIVLFLILRSSALRHELEGNLILMTALLLAQAMLGGIVVLASLPWLLIAVHLIVGYLFFGSIIWTRLKIHRPVTVAGGSRSAGLQPMVLGMITLIVIGIQVFLGGSVAGMGHQNLVTTYPGMFGRFVPPMPELSQWAVLAQFKHRWLPVLIIGLYAALRIQTIRTPLISRTRRFFTFADQLLALQVVIGIFNVILGAPAMLSALHSAVGAALFGSMVILFHDLRYGAVDAPVR